MKDKKIRSNIKWKDIPLLHMSKYSRLYGCSDFVPSVHSHENIRKWEESSKFWPTIPKSYCYQSYNIAYHAGLFLIPLNVFHDNISAWVKAFFISPLKSPNALKNYIYHIKKYSRSFSVSTMVHNILEEILTSRYVNDITYLEIITDLLKEKEIIFDHRPLEIPISVDQFNGPTPDNEDDEGVKPPPTNIYKIAEFIVYYIYCNRHENITHLYDYLCNHLKGGSKDVKNASMRYVDLISYLHLICRNNELYSEELIEDIIDVINKNRKFE
jgi:hypothetical protein